MLKLAKGFRGRAKNVISVARRRTEKALQYQYRDRRTKKREFRTSWILSINAGVRQFGLTYHTFMHGAVLSGLQLNRKILSDLSINEPYSFKSIADLVKKTLADARMDAHNERLRCFK